MLTHLNTNLLTYSYIYMLTHLAKATYSFIPFWDDTLLRREVRLYLQEVTYTLVRLIKRCLSFQSATKGRGSCSSTPTVATHNGRWLRCPFHVWGHGSCNNRCELPLSLLVNVQLREKPAPTFHSSRGRCRMNITEGSFPFCPLDLWFPLLNSLQGFGRTREAQRRISICYFRFIESICCRLSAWRHSFFKLHYLKGATSVVLGLLSV